MRLKKLFLLDMRFQAKYGFYFLYAVLTVIYIAVLFAFPENWKEKAAAILIFSDPASMGLFFMGAIVLLEKSQHTTCALAVSPVHATEYVIAKVSSLSDFTCCSSYFSISRRCGSFAHCAFWYVYIQCDIYIIWNNCCNKNCKP